MKLCHDLNSEVAKVAGDSGADGGVWQWRWWRPRCFSWQHLPRSPHHLRKERGTGKAAVLLPSVAGLHIESGEGPVVAVRTAWCWVLLAAPLSCHPVGPPNLQCKSVSLYCRPLGRCTPLYSFVDSLNRSFHPCGSDIFRSISRRCLSFFAVR